MLIYARGGPHSLRAPCLAVLELIARVRQEFVTDAEVLQEILHVYLARRQWPAGRVVFDGFVELMSGRTEPMRIGDVTAASRLADSFPAMASRDLIHLAVMLRLGVTRIISADAGFDGVAVIERLDPARFDQWRDALIEATF